MKAWVRACLAVAALAATPSASAQSQRENWNKPGDAFKIIGNAYYVGTGGLASYLFETKDGLILLDGTLPESAPQIEANIAKLGFNLRDVKILLNSHAHFDHSGGLAQLKADTRAALYAMEGDVSALEGGFYLGSENVGAMSAPPVKVDRTLKPGETITLGGFTLSANLTAGHTRGCTSWSWTAEENGKSYQAVVFCSATVAANRITPPLQYDGIVEDYRATFKKAKAMKVDVFLAPHPEFFQLDAKRAMMKAHPDQQNPFITPGEFSKFILLQEQAFEKTLAERTAKPQ
jgi:metallo-beta-lactamase class B